MKKLVFFVSMAIAAISLSSCDTAKPSQINKAVVHVSMHYGPLDSGAKTSFEYLDVKANVNIGGQAQTYTVTTEDLNKDFTVSSFPASIEISNTYTLKEAYNTEATLPEKLNVICSVAETPAYGIDLNSVTVDYFSGENLVKSERVSLSSLSGSSATTGYKAKQNGLEKTQSFLTRMSGNKYSGTIRVAE